MAVAVIVSLALVERGRGCGAGARRSARPDGPQARAPRRARRPAASPPAVASGRTSCRSWRRGPDRAARSWPAWPAASWPAFFSFGGFWDVAKLAGEVRDPAAHAAPRPGHRSAPRDPRLRPDERGLHLPRAHRERRPRATAFAAQAGEALFGPAGGRVVRGHRGGRGPRQPGRVHAHGRAARLLRDGARRRCSCARWRERPSALRNARSGRSRSRPASPACSSASARSTTIVAYFVFVTVAFIALTVAGLYRLPRPAAGAYRVPGYPVTPLGFLALLADAPGAPCRGQPAAGRPGRRWWWPWARRSIVTSWRHDATPCRSPKPWRRPDGLDQDDPVHRGRRGAAEGARGTAHALPEGVRARLRATTAARASSRPTPSSPTLSTTPSPPSGP